jgi:ABC-type dipeptide/oligopeptide/nickel transport system ATPase component
MKPVLEIRDLSTHIQLTRSVVQAVGNVDLHIEPGETLGLVGESGCGKSMTGLSIVGFLPPAGRIVGGSIRLDGRELVGLKEPELRKIRSTEIAMIFQDPLTSQAIPPTPPGSRGHAASRRRRAGSAVRPASAARTAPPTAGR